MSVLGAALPTEPVTPASHPLAGRRLPRWGVVLIVVGVSFLIAAFLYGSITYGSLGNDLKTVPYGEQLTFRPSGSYRADNFTTQPAPVSQPPACSVTTTRGQAVPVKDANPYLVDQKRHMETDYGFDLSPGAAYLVTCGSSGDTGEFAVVEVPISRRWSRPASPSRVCSRSWPVSHWP